LNVSGKFDADDGDVLTQWALSGYGIVNKPYFEIREHLENGNLIQILPETPPISSIIGCLYPHKKLQDPKMKHFMNYIIEKCSPLIKSET
ncbi:LysR substrate-binding domain-containing protein, partial [Amylibacter sp.]|nr:LysR substrate-binding domain-containing protein [Amylibacter sp.]